jgi:hypothetical protein
MVGGAFASPMREAADAPGQRVQGIERGRKNLAMPAALSCFLRQDAWAERAASHQFRLSWSAGWVVFHRQTSNLRA